MLIQPFWDARTETISYVVYDAASRDAIIVDPVLDYDPAASKTWTESVDAIIRFVHEKNLNVHLVLETHAHADHISGAQLLKQYFRNVGVAIGARITDVQKVFKSIFNLPEGFATDGSQFDRLLQDGEVVNVGTLSFETIYTPGHTPACASYRFGDAVFTGDALFLPDVGTGRCDFPGGSSTDLYNSITHRLYTLPGETRVFPGHDYPEGRGRSWECETTIAKSRETNVALPANRPQDEFVAWRNARDRSLAAPRLLFQSVQVNVDAGRLPDPAENEIRYLRIPLNVFRPAPAPGATLNLETV